MSATDGPGSGAFVSLSDIHREQRKQAEQLVRLEVGLERGRYEERLTALERRVWTASGAAAVIGIAAGWLARAIGA